MRNSTTYKIAGPRTLRLASTQILKKPIVFNGKTTKKGWGSNLQNIEKSMRELYESDGWTPAQEEKLTHYLNTGDYSIFSEEELLTIKVMLQRDQSGAEALIVAYCCENGNYRQLFINRIKPHTYLGAHIYKHIWPDKMREHNFISGDMEFDIDEILNTPIPLLKQHPHWANLAVLIQDSDNWSKSTRYYFLAKQTEHSSNYDVQPPAFRMNTLEKSGGKVVISKEDSERFLATKFALFPEIKGYHRWVKKCAEQHRMLFNLHGHPYTITCYELLESNWKELYSWIPQSTVGEITNIAYARMQGHIEEAELYWDMLQNNHDSFLCQCPLPDASAVAKKGKEFVEQEFKSPIDGVVFNMRSDVQIGFNWCPFKKDKNPLGMREVKWL